MKAAALPAWAQYPLLALTLVGCAQHAYLEIRPEDAGNQGAIYADIYAGIDGRWLGFAPYLRRHEWSSPSQFTVVVQARGYQPIIGVVQISKWYSTDEEAHINPNTFVFRMIPDLWCTDVESLRRQRELPGFR